MLLGALIVVLSSQALFVIGLGEHGIEDSDKSIPSQSFLRLSSLRNRAQIAAYPSPEEDATYFVVSLGDPPREPQISPNGSVKFFLFTRRDGTERKEEIIIGDGSSLKNSNYIPNAPLKVLIHGYKSSIGQPFPSELKTGYFSGNSVNVNVLMTDWEYLAGTSWYQNAIKSVDYVGQSLGQMIDFLFGQGLVQLKDIHLVGHNLGAHVAGIAGSSVRSGQVGRITGLDPAGLKDCLDLSKRLDSSDAEFVIGIHTDGGDHCGEEWEQDSRDPNYGFVRKWGFGDRVGHVDLYPANDDGEDHWKMEDFEICSTCQSYQLLTKSIKENQEFEACECKEPNDLEKNKCDCIQGFTIGENVSSKTRGSFYLRTNLKRGKGTMRD